MPAAGDRLYRIYDIVGLQRPQKSIFFIHITDHPVRILIYYNRILKYPLYLTENRGSRIRWYLLIDTAASALEPA